MKLVIITQNVTFLKGKRIPSDYLRVVYSGPDAARLFDSAQPAFNEAVFLVAEDAYRTHCRQALRQARARLGAGFDAEWSGVSA